MGLLPLQDDTADFVKCGAIGFVMKAAPVNLVVSTIREVAAGKPVLPPELTQSLFTHVVDKVIQESIPKATEAARMTVREQQVIDLIVRGCSNKVIASKLDIAMPTVKAHVHNILEKLALRSRLEVAAFSRGQSEPAK
jgi:DNA-binding NarL/FixJ family response regulator